MAGHTMAEDRQRSRQAKAAKAARRQEHKRQRIASAETAEAALSIAFDWYRGSAGRLAVLGKTVLGVQPNRRRAEQMMRDMTATLAAAAAEIDKECDAP